MVRLLNILTRSSPLERAIKMLVCAGLLWLSACSDLTFGGGDVGQLYRMTKAMWSGENQNITLTQAAAVPYASMGIKLADGPQAMIVLVGGSAGERIWTSAAHITLATRNGRIVRTAGLAQNLSGYQTVRSIINADGTRTVVWLADFADMGVYSAPILCRDRDAGEEAITILGKPIHTQRINETCASQQNNLDWSFHNTYWKDPVTGLTWRAIQHVHPKFGPIETEILRPPA